MCLSSLTNSGTGWTTDTTDGKPIMWHGYNFGYGEMHDADIKYL